MKGRVLDWEVLSCGLQAGCGPSYVTSGTALLGGTAGGA